MSSLSDNLRAGVLLSANASHDPRVGRGWGVGAHDARQHAEVLRLDYVSHARAKGLRERTVRHGMCSRMRLVRRGR